jgi:cell division protein FtsX
MDDSQQPKRMNLAERRRARRMNARRHSNPFLVIVMAVFVFLPLMFLGGLWLTGLLTGNWQVWNWLMGLVGG